jgi:lysozyme
MKPGIDVSHWQSDIDWPQVKAAGVVFCFYKATEYPLGKTQVYVDDRLEANAKGCSENGIYHAPYHFYRTHIKPEVQAAGFLNVIRSLPFNMRPVLDLEVAGKSGAALCADVKVFCDTIESELKVKPIIYSSGGFWRSFMIKDKYANVLPFVGYPLWIAQWTLYWPSPLYPFAGWNFWQHSETGRMPGVKTLVDLDWFNGDSLDFMKFVYPNTTAEGALASSTQETTPAAAAAT